MKKILFVVMMCLFPMGSVAFAQDAGPVVVNMPVVVGTDADVVGVFQSIIQHAMDGNWKMVFAFGLVLVMIGIKFLRKKYEKKWSKRIGGVSLLVLTFGTLLSTALLGGVSITLNLIVGMFGTAFMASGGYNLIKDIFGKQKVVENVTTVSAVLLICALL